MKNVIAISWATLPLIDPEAQQVARILKGLNNFGWKTTVFGIDLNSLSSRYKGDVELNAYYSNAFTTVHIPSAGHSIWFRVVARLFPMLTQFPDRERLWASKCGQRALALMKNQKFSAMISFGQPWSSHLVAQRLRNKSNMPWIAHFSDPWTDNPYVKYTPRAAAYNRQLEKNVMENADRLIFVNQYQMEKMLEKYPASWRNKSILMPHVIDEDLFTRKDDTHTHSSKFTLVYAGHFYGIRMPWKFFEALSILKNSGALDSLTVKFVGTVTSEIRKRARAMGLESTIIFIPTQPFFKTIRIMRNADALLLIDAPNTNLFFPSKLVDYIAVKKPILGLTPRLSPSADILQNLGWPAIDPEDESAIAKALRDLIDQKRWGELQISENRFSMLIAKYNVNIAAKCFHDMLGSLIRI